MKELSDNELLAKVAETGELGIYYILFERYQHLVYGQCRRYFTDPADCSDMVMHIFEVSFRRIKPTEVKNFSSLIYSISNNECISELRKRKSYQKHIDHYGHIQNDEKSFVQNEGMIRLTSELTEEQRQMVLDASIQQLKNEQKQCVVLFFLERKSYKEISEQLYMTDKEVKSHLQNGKRNLKLNAQSILKQLHKTTGVSNEALKKLINENIS